jgi:hypothetical protein
MDMKLDKELSAALDEIVPPGSALSDFHNTLGWSKAKLAW